MKQISIENISLKSNSKPLFVCISYDYKNQIEKLTSENFDGIKSEPFFCTELDSLDNSKGITFSFIDNNIENSFSQNSPIYLKQRVSKDEYIETVNKIKQHIQLGDIYEMNYCIEFYAENVQINPHLLFEKLQKLAQAPFATFAKVGDIFIIGSSPERFLKKQGNKLISQPIKGTRKRGKTSEEDLKLIAELSTDEKERSENIMIVDLVRNDLSKVAKRGTVNVDELCKVYSFKQVHQLISTVSCELKENIFFKDIIHATFSMGSMTGAPKVRAMQLIEQYEKTKRGIYSGAIGYIMPNGDFDLSVVIRTILYNQKEKYLSFMVGSAITDKSNPEKEYEECLVKANAMIQALS